MSTQNVLVADGTKKGSTEGIADIIGGSLRADGRGGPGIR